ncbi:MAG: hypothetical protein AMS17_18375 [Spirochaetes bacterium DG_61]|nr:MAG: hypothetical protein AMS17_18375 [Spirochaetes bacterium DG_61]
MPKTLYFDCQFGISGDMTVGAMLDLGLDRELFLTKLQKLKLEGYRIEIVRKEVNSISGTDFKVILDHGPGKHHPHRNLHNIEVIIEQSALEDGIKDLSKRIFRTIAKAEATVHCKELQEINFHEVGALDSILDIVGTAICISMLKVDHIYASPLHLGRGFIECDHGQLPVPAPATVEILKGVPVYSTGIQGEQVTPTGAAIIKCLAEGFKPLPPIRLEKIGYGMGKRDYGRFNVLRVFIGEETQLSTYHSEQLILLETNIDDMNPEIYSYLFPLLLEQGALDVFLSQIIMKKGRPGVMLSVLADVHLRPKMEELIFRETTTLGIRQYHVSRTSLERKTISYTSQFGTVKVKVIYRNGKMYRAIPEYEECRRIAHKKGLPLKEVYAILTNELANLKTDEPET